MIADRRQASWFARPIIGNSEGVKTVYFAGMAVNVLAS